MKLTFTTKNPTVTTVDDYDSESCTVDWSVEFHTTESEILNTIIKVTCLDIVIRNLEEDTCEDTENMDISIVNNAEGMITGIDCIEIDMNDHSAEIFFY